MYEQHRVVYLSTGDEEQKFINIFVGWDYYVPEISNTLSRVVTVILRFVGELIHSSFFFDEFETFVVLQNVRKVEFHFTYK